MKEHRYRISLRWDGGATTGYRDYSRNHEVSAAGKIIAIPCSSDPHFRGDTARYNPEELLVASLSECHMLAYLHLCAVNSVVVTGYEDSASGLMVEDKDGSGRFSEAVLRPAVTIAPGSNPTKALQLHDDAHRMCFVASSVNFPVRHEPVIHAAV